MHFDTKGTPYENTLLLFLLIIAFSIPYLLDQLQTKSVWQSESSVVSHNKYTMSLKGNLLKHLQEVHHNVHKEDQRMSLASGQSTLTGANPRKYQLRFHNQDTYIFSFYHVWAWWVTNSDVWATMVPSSYPWHRTQIHSSVQSNCEVKVRWIVYKWKMFYCSRVTVKQKLGELYTNKRDVLLSKIASMSHWSL